MQSNPPLSRLDQPATYKITLRGRLDASWAEWFDGMSVVTTKDNDGEVATILTGPLRDQMALHGLLARIRDLGLPLLEVQCLEESTHSNR